MVLMLMGKDKIVRYRVSYNLVLYRSLTMLTFSNKILSMEQISNIEQKTCCYMENTWLLITVYNNSEGVEMSGKCLGMHSGIHVAMGSASVIILTWNNVDTYID